MENLKSMNYEAPSAHTYFKQALSLTRENKLNDAILHIDSAIMFSSHSPFYIYQKIKILFTTHQNTTCISYILQQLDYLYKNASLYIICRSLDIYEKLTNCSPHHLKEILEVRTIPCVLAYEYTTLLRQKPHYLMALADKELVQDHFTECIQYCDLILKAQPNNWEAFYDKACAYHLLNDLYKAIQNYKACLKLNSTSAKVYNALGLSYMELGDFEKAISALKEATILNTTHLDYLSHLAECYYANRKYQEAIATFQVIEKLSPTDVQNNFNLSHTYKLKNKKFLSRHYNKKAKKQIKIAKQKNS